MVHPIFFPIDAQDEVVTTPLNGKDVCFRKPHLSDPKASEREMSRARAVRLVRLRSETQDHRSNVILSAKTGPGSSAPAGIIAPIRFPVKYMFT